MPTRPEQADLLQALYGRHGECPLIVLAPATPSDGFSIVQEAARLAIRCMTPVIVLTDTLQLQSAETWRVPELQELGAVHLPRDLPDAPRSFLPYERDSRLARPWAPPGTPGLEHRVSGQEKEEKTGNVSFDPANHERMVQTRAMKISAAADDIPALAVHGPAKGSVLVLGWGSTYGAITVAAEHCRRSGMKVANAHLRHLMPMPKNTGEVLQRYRKVLVPEMNSGQLAQVLRAAHQVEIVSLCKVQGRPFAADEIARKIESLL
jgi:2-oxoglutarate ferredoxin oxidoreductase subunit alpha